MLWLIPSLYRISAGLAFTSGKRRKMGQKGKLPFESVSLFLYIVTINTYNRLNNIVFVLLERAYLQQKNNLSICNNINWSWRKIGQLQTVTMPQKLNLGHITQSTSTLIILWRILSGFMKASLYYTSQTPTPDEQFICTLGAMFTGRDSSANITSDITSQLIHDVECCKVDLHINGADDTSPGPKGGAINPVHRYDCQKYSCLLSEYLTYILKMKENDSQLQASKYDYQLS